MSTAVANSARSALLSSPVDKPVRAGGHLCSTVEKFLLLVSRVRVPVESVDNRGKTIRMLTWSNAGSSTIHRTYY